MGAGLNNLLFQIAQNTAGIPPAVGDGLNALSWKICQNTAGTPPAVGDGLYNLYYKIAGNTAGILPRPGDRLNDLLYKITQNTAGISPKVGDSRSNLLYKIAGNTEGGGGSTSPPVIDSPDKVAGLKLWLKADAITGLSDGGPVSAWGDSSGSGLDVTQSGTARPTYKTNILNGKPVVRFDGIDDQLVKSSVTISSLAGPDTGTIFVLQKQPTPSSPTVTFNIASGGSNRINLHLTFYDSFYFDFGNFEAGRVSANQPGGWNVGYHVVVCRRGGSGGNIWVDGKSVATGTFGNLLDTAASGAIRVGSDGAGIFFSGDIVELFIYNSALSTEDRQAMEDYLGSKYNITITH